MLADPRAEVLVTSFAEGWLAVDDLEAVQPDMLLFPEFNEGLRQDFAAEMRLFLTSVLLEDRNVQELLTADYTFVNERLARHYGIDGVVGPQFRRVQLADPVRHGLLGKGALLLRTSYGDRTSPVLRGAWVLDKLMGTPPTPPPPGVETNSEHARRRAAEDGARAARAASQRRELQRLPRRDRSVRLGARELHGDRRLA